MVHIAVAGDGSRVPVWLGYVLHTGLATLVTSMLDSSRMAIVFDLDETLLVANSQSSIANKIDAAQKNRYAPPPLDVCMQDVLSPRSFPLGDAAANALPLPGPTSCGLLILGQSIC